MHISKKIIHYSLPLFSILFAISCNKIYGDTSTIDNPNFDTYDHFQTFLKENSFDNIIKYKRSTYSYSYKKIKKATYNITMKTLANYTLINTPNIQWYSTSKTKRATIKTYLTIDIWLIIGVSAYMPIIVL